MCHYLRETLSPDKTQRRQAEAFLASVEANEGFGPLFLHLLQLVGASENVTSLSYPASHKSTAP